MQAKPTTVRLSQEVLSAIDGMAKTLGRSRAWVIQDALTRYLEYEIWFREEVQKGLDDLEAGRTLSHEDVKARLRQLEAVID
jgi:predicted transcriptional regulator